MARVVWTGPALKSVAAIRDFIAEDSPAAAEAMVDRLLKAPDRLERFPLGGAVVNELSDRGVREILCGPYRLLYVVQGETCYITAVIHSSRDLAKLIEPAMWRPEG